MKSGMTPLFSGDDVERWFDHFQDRAEEKILKLLMAGGEKFVAIARKSGSYKDQTGNLRSSIGYVIAKDGEVIIGNFEESIKGSDKATGKEKGCRVAEDISVSFLVDISWLVLPEWIMLLLLKPRDMKWLQGLIFNVMST